LSFGAAALISSRAESSLPMLQSIVRKKCGMVCVDWVRRCAMVRRMPSCGMTS
jgi:hypothetical protein